MGSIARATNRVGYDLGINNLRDALIQREKEKDQEAIYSAIGEAFNNWQNNQQKNVDSAVELTGKVTNPFSPGNITQGLGQNMPKNILGEVLQTSYNPGIQTKTVKNPQAIYDEALLNKNNFDNTTMPMSLDKNFDAEQLAKLNLLKGIIDQQTNQLKPKEKDITQVNPEYDLIDKNTGNLIRQGTPAPTKASEKYERVETFDVNGQPIKKGLNKSTGKWESLGKAYYKPDKSGGKDEAGLPDVSKLVASTREGIQKIKDLKKNKGILGKEIGMTGEDAGKMVELNDELLGRQRDLIKQKYVEPIIEAVKKRDLQPAIDTIKGVYGTLDEKLQKLGKGATPQQIRTEKEKYINDIPKVIDKFINKNPDYSPEKDVIKAYFELFLL